MKETEDYLRQKISFSVHKIKMLERDLSLERKIYKGSTDKLAVLKCPFSVGQTIKNKRTGEKVFIESIKFGWLLPNTACFKFAGRIIYRKLKKNGGLYKIASFGHGNIYHHPERWEIIEGKRNA